MDRGYRDFSRLFTLHQSGAFFVTRAKRGMNAHRVYSMKADRSTGIICDQRIVLDGFYISQDYSEQLRRIRFKDPETGKTLVFLTNNTALPANDCRTVQKPLANRIVLQVDQAASAYQTFHRQQRERSENANLVRRRHLRADRHCQKGA